MTNATNKLINGVTNTMVKESRTPKKIAVFFDYDPDTIKVSLTPNALSEPLTEYYSARMHLAAVAKKQGERIADFMKTINGYMSKDNPTDEDLATIARYQEEMHKAQAQYKWFTTTSASLLNDSYKLVPDTLYQAYGNKFKDEDAWKKALEDFFKSKGSALTPSMYSFVDRGIGLQSGSNNQRLKDIHITTMKAKKFTALFLDILLQLSLDKGVLKKAVIEDIMKEAESVINEWDSIPTVKAIHATATIEDYKELFVKVGIQAKDSIGLSECRDLYAQGLQVGAFIAY